MVGDVAQRAARVIQVHTHRTRNSTVTYTSCTEKSVVLLHCVLTRPRRVEKSDDVYSSDGSPPCTGMMSRGSMLVLRATSLAEARGIVENDPYYNDGVVRTHELCRPFGTRHLISFVAVGQGTADDRTFPARVSTRRRCLLNLSSSQLGQLGISMAL